MSSDSARENASVVDSSLTECKQDMANLDDPENSSYKADKDQSPAGIEESGHVHNLFGDITARKKGKLYDTRYFIIKSFNHENIQLSVDHGLWATQIMNEPVLEEAFYTSDKVILIFSVNKSGFFQGYAQMMSSVGRREDIWNRGRGKKWGRSFEVKWLRLSNLPFEKTLHLQNPLNEDKPVKISRDGQELPPDIGEALCELFEGNSDADAVTQIARVEPFSSLQDEGYRMRSAPLGWDNAPMLYPPSIYHRQLEASGYQFPPLNSAGFFASKDMPIGAWPSGVARTRESHLSANHNTVRGHKASFGYDCRGLPADSQLGSTLTVDDLLEMSYEEYLEAHSKGRIPLSVMVAQARFINQHLPSKKRDDDWGSSHAVELARSRKRARHSSSK